ncbi:MAG: nucleotidyltransferase family protein, partial [Candidatus Bathyarchaeia archaeon]
MKKVIFSNSFSLITLRAIVLAGGFAKRLQRLGELQAKPLLKIGDKFLMDYTMNKLEELSLDEVVVTINKRFEKEFKTWIKSMKYSKVRLHVEPSTKEEEKLGAVLSLATLLDTLVEDAYLIVAGDNLFSLSLRDFIDFYRSKGAPVIALYDVENLELVKMYSCIVLSDDGRILEFKEKPARPTSTLISTAIYLLPWNSLTKVKEYINGGGNRDAPDHFISWLCRK